MLYLKTESDGFKIYKKVLDAPPRELIPIWETQYYLTGNDVVSSVNAQLNDNTLLTDIYKTYFVKIDPDYYQVYDYDDYDTYSGGIGTWSNVTSEDTDDGLINGFPSNTFKYKDGTSLSIDKTFTIPSTVNGRPVLGAFIRLCTRAASNANLIDITKVELFDSSNKLMPGPLIGLRSKVFSGGTNYPDASRYVRRTQITDNSGLFTVDGSITGTGSFESEVRFVTPGTYKVKASTVSGSSRLSIGRLLIHYVCDFTPDEADIIEYNPEYSDNIETTVSADFRQTKRFGAYTRSPSSGDILVFYDSAAADYVGHIAHGSMFQNALDATVSLNGQSTSPIFIGVEGPFDEISIDIDRDYVSKNPITSGANASTTASDPVVTLTGATLTGVEIGDFLRLNGRTDGFNGHPFFQITDINGVDVTVTPTPSSTASGIAWTIRETLQNIIENYRITDNYTEVTLPAVVKATDGLTSNQIYSPLYGAPNAQPLTTGVPQNRNQLRNVTSADNPNDVIRPYDITAIEGILNNKTFSFTPTGIPGTLADKILIHYDNYPIDRPEASGILVFEVPYAEFLSCNITQSTNTDKMFVDNGNPYKFYCTAIKGASFFQDETYQVKFRFYWANKNYFNKLTTQNTNRRTQVFGGFIR